MIVIYRLLVSGYCTCAPIWIFNIVYIVITIIINVIIIITITINIVLADVYPRPI